MLNADATRDRVERERSDIIRAASGRTICSMFQETAARHAELPALVTKRGGQWQAITWGEYAERVRALTLALVELGLAAGQTVAILSGTREEYNQADLAVTHAGGIAVALYQTSSPSQVAYVTDHAEAVLAMAESAAQAEKFLATRAQLPRVQRLVVFEGRPALPADPWILAFDDLLARGRELARVGAEAFEERWCAVRPEHRVALIYTSGTTGPPKGAILTHAQVCQAQEAGARLFPFEPGEQIIGYLPMAHVAERNLSLWGAVRTARTIHFCPDINELGRVLVEVRPHAFFAVPRIWEKMHAALTAGIAAEADPARKAAVAQCLDVGLQSARLRAAGQPVPTALDEARARAEALVFLPMRQRLGLDRARITASGAAPIAPEILEFFHAIGLPILEVYGQTEGCGIATINRPDRVRIGTVGLAYPGVEIRIAEDGEILLRGPNCFTGYYKEPALTADTLDADGWLHSGDVGAVDADGFLRILDRKKDIIIGAGGHNVTPSNLENALKRQPLISQAMVVGDRRPYLVALLTLDEAAVRPWARAEGLGELAPGALLDHPALRAAIQAGVDAVNADVARVEQIKRWAVLPRDWSPATDELTPTLKVRRKVVADKYRAHIEALYAGDGAGGTASPVSRSAPPAAPEPAS
jgi:long-chain acyl-CoA synthetase